MWYIGVRRTYLVERYAMSHEEFLQSPILGYDSIPLP
jgi:hypothetical protein